MKTLSKIEIKGKIVEFFKTKGIQLEETDTNLTWFYNLHYSKFRIIIKIEDGKWSDETKSYKHLIRYGCSEHINGINKRRTSINSGFLTKIYNIAIWIKESLIGKALEVKELTDRKNKYCTELEKYYKKIHKNVNISTIQMVDYIHISINCNDGYNDYTSYTILHKDNKYYLTNKSQNKNKVMKL